MDYTAEDFSFIMTTNFESAYHLSQLAHPLLKVSGAGSIVFLSSVCGVVSINVGSIYSATKGNSIIVSNYLNTINMELNKLRLFFCFQSALIGRSNEPVDQEFGMRMG